MISLRETARRHDIDAGYLSRRVRAGKAAQGHDLTPFVVIQEGKVQGFEFPPGHSFPDGSTLNVNVDSTRAQQRKNPVNGHSGTSSGLSGASSSTAQHSTSSDESTGEIMASIDHKLHGSSERSSALKAAGIKAAQESASALTDALRENPAALPLLANPARHATTLGMGLLVGWYLNRRYASVSGTITGALLAATAADVFIRRDESILLGLFARGKDDETRTGDGSLNGSTTPRSDVLVGEGTSEMVERIMQSVKSTTN